MSEQEVDRSWRTTSLYLNTEDQKHLAFLIEQTGLSRSAVIRGLIKKAAVGDGPDDQTAELREHVAALARLVL